MSCSHSLPLSSLFPSCLSFVIYHLGDEFKISIIELLNIDGSSKSLTRSQQGRGINPSVCSLAPVSAKRSHLVGSCQVRRSLYPTIISHLLWDLLMFHQGYSPQHLLLSYITIYKKRKKRKEKSF